MARAARLLVGFCALALPAAAQTRIGLQAGVIATSPLVRDSIVEPLSVRPDPAPTIGFWLETRLDATYRLGLGLATAWSRLARRSPSETVEVVPLTVWSPALTLRRDLRPGVSARATLGAMVYDPDHRAGTLFSQGSPVIPVVGAGLSYDRSVGGDLLLRIDLGYDVHRFTTTALRDRGFSGERAVHRVGVSVGVSRTL
ncbi:MAG: hypothetical protein HY560_08000 [Gemmatimonadetes bacterium]|nr:hypothetical protein [Gemmatimonadota bacterium]